MDQITHDARLRNWTELVRQCMSRPSGQTIIQWCRETGVSEKQYYYWQRRVRRQAAQLPDIPSASKVPAEVTFAEIKVPVANETDLKAELITGFRPDVLISRGDLVIGISNKTSDRILSRILREVADAR